MPMAGSPKSEKSNATMYGIVPYLTRRILSRQKKQLCVLSRIWFHLSEFLNINTTDLQLLVFFSVPYFFNICCLQDDNFLSESISKETLKQMTGIEVFCKIAISSFKLGNIYELWYYNGSENGEPSKIRKMLALRNHLRDLKRSNLEGTISNVRWPTANAKGLNCFEVRYTKFGGFLKSNLKRERKEI